MADPVVDNGSGTDYTVSTKTLSNGSEVQQIELVTAAEGGSATEFGTTTNPVKVDGSNVTQPVSAASLPLPSGAATAANQSTELSTLNSILTELNTKLDEATFTGRVGEVQASPTANTVLGRLKDLLTGIVLAAGNNNIGDVDVASSALPTGAASSAKQDTAQISLDAITTALQIIDDWDESDRAKVNPIVGQAGVAGNTGVVGATTQRVTLATDVALPAGSNTIGAVTGTKQNNNAAPGTNNVGALTAVASASNPSLTEGNMTAISQDLSGRQRTMVPKVTGSGSLVMTSTSNTFEIPIEGINGLAFTITGTWTGTIKFRTIAPDNSTHFFLAGFNMSNAAGTDFTNDFETQTTVNGTWIATGIGGFSKIRLDVGVAGTGTATINWCGTGQSDYVFTQTFGDLKDNTGTAAYAVWPVIIGGTAYSALGASSPALANFPTPRANDVRSKVLTSAYQELLVQQMDHHYTQTIAANGTSIGINSLGAQSICIQLRGTWVGTIAFEMSFDGTNYTAAVGYNVETFTGAFDLTTTGNGTWLLLLANGAAYVRCRSTVWTSGTATVTLRGSNAPPLMGSYVFGDKAHDAADSSTSPMKIGGKALTGGLPAAVASADRTNALFDVYGRLVYRQLDTWKVQHQPVAATQATISQASGGGSVKNVCTSITCTLSSSAAPTAGRVIFNLRDGASGAGTILWSGALSLQAVAGVCAPPIQLSGLWIEGSAATAMTLESAAAPAANIFATVAMTGTITQ